MYTNPKANVQGFTKTHFLFQFLSIRMNGKLKRCITFTYWAHEEQRSNTVKYIHNIKLHSSWVFIPRSWMYCIWCIVSNITSPLCLRLPCAKLYLEQLLYFCMDVSPFPVNRHFIVTMVMGSVGSNQQSPGKWRHGQSCQVGFNHQGSMLWFKAR